MARASRWKSLWSWSTDIRSVGRRTRGAREELSLDFELEVDHGVRIAARASAGLGHVAHTTPIYVTVDGGGFHNPNTLQANLDRCERDLAELERELANPGTQLDSEARRHADSLRLQIEEARQGLRHLAERLRER